MNSHTTAYGLIASAFLACGGAGAAVADDAPAKASSSGLTVAISKVALNQRQLETALRLFETRSQSSGYARIS